MGLWIIRRGAAFVLSCGSGLRVVFSLSALMQQIRFRFEIESDGGVVGTPGQTDSVITTPNLRTTNGFSVKCAYPMILGGVHSFP